MRRPTIPQRCHSCGSLVSLKDKVFRDEVVLNFRCPGCGSSGGSHYKDLPLEEAQRLAERQNALAATPEAAAEAERWKSRVARWVASDAAAFLDLVRTRFPEWREYLTYQSGLYLNGAYSLTIPSANPQVETPLTLTVAVNEVLMSWFEMWHLHIFRYQDAGQDDKSHLDRALKEIEDFVEERIVAVEHFKDGSCCGGGSIRPGKASPRTRKKRRSASAKASQSPSSLDPGAALMMKSGIPNEADLADAPISRSCVRMRPRTLGRRPSDRYFTAGFTRPLGHQARIGSITFPWTSVNRRFSPLL